MKLKENLGPSGRDDWCIHINCSSHSNQYPEKKRINLRLLELYTRVHAGVETCFNSMNDCTKALKTNLLKRTENKRKFVKTRDVGRCPLWTLLMMSSHHVPIDFHIRSNIATEWCRTGFWLNKPARHAARHAASQQQDPQSLPAALCCSGLQGT